MWDPIQMKKFVLTKNAQLMEFGQTGQSGPHVQLNVEKE